MLFKQIKKRAPFVRAAMQEWKPVGVWLVWLAALFGVPCIFLRNGSDRVELQGMLFQWAGVIVVAWGLVDTRRNLFGKPPLREELWEKARRLGHIIKPPRSKTVSGEAGAYGIGGMNVDMNFRHPVTGDVEARIEALVKNQRLIDEDLSNQQKAIDHLQAETNTHIKAESREREEADNRISDQLEKAIIGGIHLEFAGVAFLLVGIAFTSIPGWIACGLQSMPF